MNRNPHAWTWRSVSVAIGVVLVMTAIATVSRWWPALSSSIDATLASRRGSVDVDHAADHTKACGSHETGSTATTLFLSPQARMNLGLTSEYLRPVTLSPFCRSITVPAVVVAKPGRSSIIVSSPLNGVVTHVHAVTGEAVLPGELLFEVRLTYEDLVETQTAYLKTISELEVEGREIARLEAATASGAISGKTLLDRRYAKEKLDAFAKSQREALRMHGLSDRQVDTIGSSGKLLRDLQIVAPGVDEHDHEDELRLSQLAAQPVSFTLTQRTPTTTASRSLTPLVIDDLKVHKGQAIMAGEKLCSLSDYSQLFIEGKAFENDIAAITQSANRGWSVEAIINGSSGKQIIDGLSVKFVSNAIDPQSRTLSMFVELPNEVVQDETNRENQRYLTWKYRLGQRMELQVPVEQWEDQIVVPIDAVVKDGADWFVFLQNGSGFTRVPVHVRHRDQHVAVIANDGSVYSGDVLAMKAAHQMQMAIKNQSGGAVDPHAGHNH